MATYYENMVLCMVCSYFEKTYESNFFLYNATQYWIAGTGSARIGWCAQCVGRDHGSMTIVNHINNFLSLITTDDGVEVWQSTIVC